MPWNLHEPEEGVFDLGNGGNDMSEFLNFEEYIKAVQAEDLFMIIRPGPYICAEWEFGGLPSWLLRYPNLTIRSFDSVFMSKVDRYYGAILPILQKYEFTKGGPIIAFQIENEYGGTLRTDKEYLGFLRDLMRNNSIEGLLFTSDPPAFGDRGGLPGILQTANFQVGPEEGLDRLKEIQPDMPSMVMEYWTGWFDHWTESHHTRTVEEYMDILTRILNYPASVNLYMFHGGTNWGFMNGANVIPLFPYYGPDVTSYDYDAPLSEAGDYTDKYWATQQLLPNYMPYEIAPVPQPPETTKVAYPPIATDGQLTFDELIAKVDIADRVNSENVMPMELLNINNGNGQSYGYVLYRKTEVSLNTGSTLKIMGNVKDVAIVMVNGQRQTEVFEGVDQLGNFGYWPTSDGELVLTNISSGAQTLDIFVENFGRNNYGQVPKDFYQYKGIVSGPVLIDGNELSNWEIVSLQFKKQWLNNLAGWGTVQAEISGPTLFRATLTITGEPNDTFLDMSAWHKGVVFVNGFNLGRYFKAGPQHTLFIPGPLLKEGTNDILVFEHYIPATQLTFTSQPILS